jgi:hypothetical protein
MEERTVLDEAERRGFFPTTGGSGQERKRTGMRVERAWRAKTRWNGALFNLMALRCLIASKAVVKEEKVLALDKRSVNILQLDVTGKKNLTSWIEGLMMTIGSQLLPSKSLPPLIFTLYSTVQR